VNEIEVSVIVCTKNRSDSLKSCFESLSIQKFSPYEVLVIDSSDDDKQIIRNKALAETYMAKYIFYEHLPLASARNLGIRMARGKIIAFIDDDCIATSDWLKKIHAALSINESVKICTGRTITLRNRKKDEQDDCSDAERFLDFDKGTMKKFFTASDIRVGLNMFSSLSRLVPVQFKGRAPAPWSVGSGSNMAFRREALNFVGFNEKLGLGSISRGGEDNDIFYRALKTGFKIAYEPGATVYHARRTVEELAQTAYNNGMGFAAIVKIHALREPNFTVHFFLRIAHLFYLSLKYWKKGDRLMRNVLRAYLNGMFSAVFHQIEAQKVDKVDKLIIVPYTKLRMIYLCLRL